MKTLTKEQLIARNAQLDQETTVQALALCDLISDRVKWFRKGHAMLGVSRPTGASGGILIHRSNDNGKGFEFVGAKIATSQHDQKTAYRVGEIVRCNHWCDDFTQECAGGIHFFITRIEAENY